MTASLLVTAAGALVFVVGLVLTLLQYFGIGLGAKRAKSRSVKAGTKKINVGLTTTYPGILLIVIGLLALVVAAAVRQ